ncbi:hypothetical protein HD806DRAFT_513590 [Xylariaceae sp. AK1471]|nr:hypothetical protein HD806DRAFT_513590 [Xylariaceae sp. AK1471]
MIYKQKQRTRIPILLFLLTTNIITNTTAINTILYKTTETPSKQQKSAKTSHRPRSSIRALRAGVHCVVLP